MRPSSEIAISTVLAADTAFAGAAQRAALVLTNVAEVLTSPPKLHVSSRVGARLAPRSVIILPPEIGPYEGMAEARDGVMATVYTTQ